jgi:hypothetical protein
LLLFPNVTSGKIKLEKKDSKLPICTTVGHLQCPKGFKPICPNNAKPSCIFLGTKQYPACTENSKDKITYNYSLNGITCEKSK